MAIVMGSIVFIAAVIVKRGKDVVGSFVNGFLTIIIANAPQGLPGIYSEVPAFQSSFFSSFRGIFKACMFLICSLLSSIKADTRPSLLQKQIVLSIFLFIARPR